MKKQLYTLIAMMILAGFVATSSAKAQTSASRQLIANIPFEFSVGNKAMPAGDYTVRQINPASDRAVLQLRSKDGSASAMVQMTFVAGKAQESAKLDREEMSVLFESAADAVVFGDLDALRALLDDEPALVHARSPRVPSAVWLRGSRVSPQRTSRLPWRRESSSSARYEQAGNSSSFSEQRLGNSL